MRNRNWIMIPAILGVLSLVILAGFPQRKVLSESVTSIKPVAYYSFDDKNNLGYDFSGNGNNLVKVEIPDGGTLATDSGALTNLGTSLKLNATAGLRTEIVDFTDSLTTVTVTFFYKDTSTEVVPPGTNTRLLSSGIYGNTKGFFFACNNYYNDEEKYMQQLFFGLGGYDWWSQAYRTNWVLDEAHSDYDHRWHYVALVSDYSTKMSYMYMDGSATVYPMASLKKPSLECPEMPLAIGGHSNSDDGGVTYGFDEGFTGQIDELRFYNIAFTASQVDELHTAYTNGTIKATGNAPTSAPSSSSSSSSSSQSSASSAAQSSTAASSTAASSGTGSSSAAGSAVSGESTESTASDESTEASSGESLEGSSASAASETGDSSAVSSASDEEPAGSGRTVLIIVLAVVAAAIIAAVVIVTLKKKKSA